MISLTEQILGSRASAVGELLKFNKIEECRTCVRNAKKPDNVVGASGSQNAILPDPSVATVINVVSSAVETVVKDMLSNADGGSEMVASIAVAVGKEVAKVISEPLTRISHLIQALQAEVAVLKSKTEEEFDRHEQYSRRNCLRFYGIPEQEKERTGDIVSNLVAEKLNIQLPPYAIASHRLGKQKSEERGRPIIVDLQLTG